MTSLEQQVYDELTGAGFSMAEAAGIMGSLQNESEFNPEARNPAGPQAGLGLAQWETTFYPQAINWITGNTSRDMQVQVEQIVQEFQSLGLKDGTAAQVAGEWSAQFERCKGCDPGGAQYNQRVANAQAIFNQAQSGKWPSGPGIQTTGTVTTSGGFSLNPFQDLANVINGIPELFGSDSWSNLFTRFGLIVFGGAIVLIGIFVFFERDIKTTVTAVVPGAPKIGSTAQQSAAKQNQVMQRASQS